MCGIAGTYGNPDPEALRRVVEVMRHRGTDDQGLVFDETCGLAHARLSTVDLSPVGRQPLLSEDGSVRVVVNGEVYNYQELRRQLVSKGHRFASQSDSEVVVHGYEEWGKDTIKRLRGMFGLAVYDPRKRLLVLARDPIGKKPLYYWHQGSRLVFVSEIKALFEAGVPKEVNWNAVYGYLMYGYSVGRETLFKGVKKVLGGEMLTFDGAGEPRIEQYWDIGYGRINISRLQSYNVEPYLVTELRHRLDESAGLRMTVSDVPVGSFLSGGIDSAAVTALCAQYCRGDFHTFSVGFPSSSELPYAREVSQHLGTKHHELVVTPEMVAEDLDKVAWHFDEPVGDAATFCNYYLAREAKRNGIKVVVAGEGGDELFGGYEHYRIGQRLAWWFALPRFIREWGGKVAEKSPDPTLRRLGMFACLPDLEAAHDYMTQAVSDNELRRLWKRETSLPFVAHRAQQIRSEALRRVFVPSPLAPDPFTAMLARDCKNLLPEKFLMKADKATMAWGVEERCPLLDKEVVELAFSIPPKWKLRYGQEKWILRQAVKDLLPESSVNRKKQGFGTPVVEWLKYPRIKEQVQDSLRNGALVRELFKAEEMEKLAMGIDRIPETGLRSHFQTNTVWTIFALQLWHDVYFGNPKPRASLTIK